MRANIRFAYLLAAVALTFALSACGPSSAPRKTDTLPGEVGTSFDVTVFRAKGGTVTSTDGRINCGTASTATLCGPVSFGWAETATLIATPDAGNMFGTWAGDCLGRQVVNGQYTCFLDTKTSGADKYAVAVFDVAGRADHPNFHDPAVHGLEYLKWVKKDPNTFECTYCHGANYAGIGMAPSCNDCHASNGHPDWQNDCSFCHGAPPPPPPATYPGMTHPAVSNDIKNCFGCHQGTVDQNGQIIPGGNHQNGNIDATGGHAAGYNDPKIHGRDFFDAISSNPTQPYCTGCHGTSYEITIANGRSCNTCHAAPVASTPPGGGWNGTDWKSNCTFCHGTRTIAYAPANLNRAAPPDAISQRLDGAPAADRTGAHAIHLSTGPFAGPMLCSNCHVVPPSMAHISGRDVRATVIVQGPGAAGPEAGYQADSSCLTRCHGTNPSPAWTVTGISCEGCHGIPPATAIHAGISGADRTVCAGCHPDTVTSGGVIDTAGGKHVNGQVDAFQHPAGFNLPINHGPAYLDHVAGVSGALDCQRCHGVSLDYCSNCHARPENGGWLSWKDNCTFCHGTRTPAFNVSTDPLNPAAPPDAIQERLDGTEQPTRTGQHSLHVNDGGFVPMTAVACGGCHPDPSAGSHISASRRAEVTFDGAKAFPGLSPSERARLPVPFGSYNPVDGSCTNYCHGSSMQGGVNTVMNWTNDFGSPSYTPILDCTDCHGLPPATGSTTIGHTYAAPAPTNTVYCGAAGCANHEYHRRAQNAGGWDSCAACHLGSAQGTVYNGLHANGKPDIVFSTSINGKPVTAAWNPVDRTCTSTCHTKSGTATPHPW